MSTPQQGRLRLNAWADPEHMRLAECRSWWDELSGDTEHGAPLSYEDPWFRFLYTAEPCTADDPEPGVRLLRAGQLIGRMSPQEAHALAGDLLEALTVAEADPTGVFVAALETAGHLTCGGWSYAAAQRVLRCKCGTRIPTGVPA